MGVVRKQVTGFELEKIRVDGGHGAMAIAADPPPCKRGDSVPAKNLACASGKIGGSPLLHPLEYARLSSASFAIRFANFMGRASMQFILRHKLNAHDPTGVRGLHPAKLLQARLIVTSSSLAI